MQSLMVINYDKKILLVKVFSETIGRWFCFDFVNISKIKNVAYTSKLG